MCVVVCYVRENHFKNHNEKFKSNEINNKF